MSAKWPPTPTASSPTGSRDRHHPRRATTGPWSFEWDRDGHLSSWGPTARYPDQRWKGATMIEVDAEEPGDALAGLPRHQRAHPADPERDGGGRSRSRCRPQAGLSGRDTSAEVRAAKGPTRCRSVGRASGKGITGGGKLPPLPVTTVMGVGVVRPRPGPPAGLRAERPHQRADRPGGRGKASPLFATPPRSRRRPGRRDRRREGAWRPGEW